MTDQELQSWLDHRISLTNPLYDLIDDLDDTFGWGARLEHMWSKNNVRFCGLLLTGPNGCGKHTAAAHMLRILVDTHSAAILDGQEFCSDSFAAAANQLKYVLNHPNADCYGNSYPWFLILENMENCCYRRELLTLLGQLLTEIGIKLKQSTNEWLATKKEIESRGSIESVPPRPEPSVFLVLIDSKEEDIPSILRSCLRLCRMTLPNANRRRAYLDNKEFSMIQSFVNLDLLVNSTDGLTYAQLVDLARNLEGALGCLPKDQFSFADEELLEFLQEQLPDPPMDDPLQSLADSARQFIEQLPELMQHMGTSVVAAPAAQQNEIGQSSPNSAPAPEPIPNEQDFKKEINDMPIKDLCTDLFGKERLEHIKASRANRQRA